MRTLGTLLGSKLGAVPLRLPEPRLAAERREPIGALAALGWRLAALGLKLAAVGWKLEVMGWELAALGWKLAALGWKLAALG